MRILFLNKRMLFPTNTGGRIRTLNVVRYLARWHDLVYLCAMQPGEEEFVAPMRELGLSLETVPWRETPRDSLKFYRDLAINLGSRYPFNVNKDFDPALRERALALIARQPFDLVICDFVQMARNAVGLPAAASLLFQHNVESQIFQRHAETDAGWPRRRFMAYQAWKMRRFEGWAGKQFDAVVAVSPQDQRLFETLYGWTHVRTIDTAVDTEFFQPVEGAEQSQRVLFVGSLDWLPNQDGLRYFVRDIWPRIHDRLPGAVFQVVGRNPTSEMLSLGDQAGVQVVGAVADTRPHLAEAAVVVVPLRIGGGTRIKIFEALAMRKAVVSTSLGAEGLPVKSGQDLVLADDAAAFAASVIRLLEDSSVRSSLGAKGRRLVESGYSAETVARQFERICLETCQMRKC